MRIDKIKELITDTLIENFNEKISKEPDIDGNFKVTHARVDEWATISGRVQLCMETMDIVTNHEDNANIERYIISIERVS